MSTEVRERVSQFQLGSTRVARRPLGLSPVEIIVAAVVLIIFVAVVVHYATSLRPEHDRLNTIEEEYQKLLKQRVVTASANAPQANPQASTAKAALDSLETFKAGHLKLLNSTERDLLDEINGLSKKNSVQLTSGIPIDWHNVKQNEEQQSSSKRKEEEEALEAFSSLSAQFSVAGNYSNLRSFIKDLESSKLFVVVNSINLVIQEEREGGERGRRSRVSMSGIVLTINLSVPVRPAQ